MTSPRPTQVISELALRLVVPDGSALPVVASLQYDTTDPFAVHVTFHTGGPGEDTHVVWTFSRQLIVDGLDRPAGMGDVRVWPSADDGGASIALSLCSPSGEALFQVPRNALASFLSRTFAEVPIGAEGRHIDLDAEVATLLEDFA